MSYPDFTGAVLIFANPEYTSIRSLAAVVGENNA